MHHCTEDVSVLSGYFFSPHLENWAGCGKRRRETQNQTLKKKSEEIKILISLEDCFILKYRVLNLRIYFLIFSI